MTYTFKPGASSVYNLNIVPELPPAPAALVPAGLEEASFRDWDWAARRLMMERTPPGIGGDVGLEVSLYSIRLAFRVLLYKI